MEKQTRVTKAAWNDLPLEQLSEVLGRKFITGDNIMLAQVYLKQDCIVPMHQHDNEQITYIIEGELIFWVGTEDSAPIALKAGEVMVLPPNVPHKAQATVDTLDLDIFCPPRQDWLAKTDDYLRR